MGSQGFDTSVLGEERARFLSEYLAKPITRYLQYVGNDACRDKSLLLCWSEYIALDCTVGQSIAARQFAQWFRYTAVAGVRGPCFRGSSTAFPEQADRQPVPFLFISHPPSPRVECLLSHVIYSSFHNLRGFSRTLVH